MAKFGYYQSEHKNNNAYAFIQKHVWEHPEKTLLSWLSPIAVEKWDQKSDLYQEVVDIKTFGRIASKLANKFLESGIRENDKVVLELPISIQYFLCIFALQKVGAVVVTLENWSDQNKTNASLKLLSPRALISYYGHFKFIEKYEIDNMIPVKLIAGQFNPEEESQFDGVIEKFMISKNSADTIPIIQSHAAFISFENLDFNTQIPVVKSHHQLAAERNCLNNFVYPLENEVNYNFFASSIYQNFLACITTVLPSFEFQQAGPEEFNLFKKQLNINNVNSLTCPPLFLKKITPFLLQKKYVNNKIKRVVTGGAPLSRDDITNIVKIFPNAQILIVYSHSQTGPLACLSGKQFASLKTKHYNDPNWVEDGVCMGKFIKGVNHKIIKVSNETIEIKDIMDWMNYECPKGQAGELLVAAEHITRNFYKDELNEKRYKIVDEFGITWHRTGDLVRVDDEGRLWLLGKCSESIKVENKYLYPGRVELIMKKINSVKQAGYFCHNEKTICTYSTHNQQSDQKVENDLKSILTKHQIKFDDIIHLENIPTHPIIKSKVDYEQLKKMF